jgi:XTP/dITP diphosphohydrolase
LPSGVELPPEDGNTLLANARIKARAAAAATGKIALADDTGLEVDALGGDPGVYSARFAGENATFDDNNRLLLERLRGIHGVNRRARFRCVFVLADPAGKEVSAEGRIEGFIQEAPRGTHGFGYDPLFVPEGSDRTLAELSAEEKNAISHRARAAAALLETLRARGRWTP